MTGGSCAGDRAGPFSTLETWQHKLIMVVIDEGQQYGGDHEVTPSVPAPSGVHTLPMEVDSAGRGATSASSSTARAPMDVDSATAKGPSTTDGAMTIPRELANDILAAIPHLPNEWPLAKIDLILQNTDKY